MRTRIPALGLRLTILTVFAVFFIAPVLWLILALVPPLGGPGVELCGRGFLPYSPALVIPALLFVGRRGRFWRLGALIWSVSHGMYSHGDRSADASFALSNRSSTLRL